MPAKALMVMGTASNVGKSVVTTALCRAFARNGVRVAPFKSQNMSNNAAVCHGGGEIGRAQAVQAQACGIAPTVDMNPVLLKPESILGCQVVIHGRARFQMGAGEDHYYRAQAWPAIVSSYRALADKFDLIVIEGAGGAAEINLRERELVNWPIAELAEAPVLLVADIDRGGVFASLVGTFELLSDAERKRVRGFIINKFRGELSLLESGLHFLEKRTGVPVLGVLPYQQLGIPEEDSAALDELAPARDAPVKIGVVHFPRISNYTDFQPLEGEQDVAVHYLTDPQSAPELDLLILPGTKSTAADLKWLRSAGWENFMARHRRSGRWTLGICGGYQMLGERILDPEFVESERRETIALGLLPVVTIFHNPKITRQVTAIETSSGLQIAGYEIHAGRIEGTDSSNAIFRVIERDSIAADDLEGTHSSDGRILGTSIHGLFDNSAFRRRFIDNLRVAKGLAALGQQECNQYDAATALDRLADMFEEHVSISRIAEFAGLSWVGAVQRPLQSALASK